MFCSKIKFEVYENFMKGVELLNIDVDLKLILSLGVTMSSMAFFFSVSVSLCVIMSSMAFLFLISSGVMMSSMVFILFGGINRSFIID